jgi:quercetin dioxygenase-like cupin family protein
VALGGKPYSDQPVSNNSFIRTFESGQHPDLYEWHRDHADRTVRIIEGKGWQFQLDNELPQPLQPGDVLSIDAETYHRLIPGTEKLVIEIQERR